VVSLNPDSDGITATLDDGTVIKYGHPDKDHQFKKLFKAIEKCTIPSPDICPPDAAISQMLFINALHELPDGIETFPYDAVVIEKDRRWVRELGERMVEAYGNWSDNLVKREA
jgi:hypothetical protein